MSYWVGGNAKQEAKSAWNYTQGLPCRLETLVTLQVILCLQGVWADPVSKDVAQVFQAWAVLEAQHGTVQLARELFKCAVKANPQSEVSWAVCVATTLHSVSSRQKVCCHELVSIVPPGLVMINAICHTENAV